MISSVVWLHILLGP